MVADTTLQALVSRNPFKFLRDTITFHRTELGFAIASGSIAALENIPHQKAKAKISILAWNSPYLKKQQ
jgi:hypothetical protein